MPLYGGTNRLKTTVRTERDLLRGKGAVEIAGEAMCLLRNSPVRIWALYLVGGIPFVIMFLFFWADMSRSAFARERMGAESLALAIAFLWMKHFHALFAQELAALLAGRVQCRAPLSQRFGMALTQATIQPWGLFLIPLSLLLAFPFCATLLFFQNVSVLGDGRHGELKDVLRESWREATFRSGQGHILVWLLSPWALATGVLVVFGSMWLAMSISPEFKSAGSPLWFMFSLLLFFLMVVPFAPFAGVVAGNVAVTVALLPHVLRIFFGVETVFTLSGIYGLLNTTFLMAVICISYLCLDPVLKAACVLRCFHGRARATGEDLLAELRQLEETRNG